MDGCVSLNIVQIAIQFIEKLETAVLVLQIESSYSIIGVASETIQSPPILFPIRKPHLFISKGV